MPDPRQSISEVPNSYEAIARLAQHFLAARPVVVLGTGATIPHGLPSMPDLADALLGSIKNNPPGWIEFSRRLAASKDLEKALQEVALPGETVDRLVSETWEIVSSKDLEFFERLMSGPTKYPLVDLFRYLLRIADAQLNVVTTNYDRLAEYAANLAGAYVSTGITAGWLQRFVPACVGSERSPEPGYEGQVSLFKVHGSLDWFRDAAGDIVGMPLPRKVPKDTKPLVVTPGVTKYREVHKDPFRTVMTAADAVLRNASCYVCVGYGFNDEHVQPILVSRVMKNDIPLVVVTRKLTQQTRDAFLARPPRRFLFVEEANGGTSVHLPEFPHGTNLPGIHIWELENFMKMIAGEDVR